MIGDIGNDTNQVQASGPGVINQTPAPVDSTNPRLMSQGADTMKSIYGEQISGSFDRAMPLPQTPDGVPLVPQVPTSTSII